MRSPQELVAFAADRGVTATLHPAEMAMPTVPLAAEALGIPVEEMTKNVLFFVRGEPVLVIGRGAQRIDERRIAAHFCVGRKQVKLANGEQTLATTGFEAGCVPPFGHKVALPTLLDTELFGLARVYGGTNDPKVLISVGTEALVEMVGASWLSAEGPSN